MPRYSPALREAIDRLEAIKLEAGASATRAPIAGDADHADAEAHLLRGLRLEDVGNEVRDFALRTVVGGLQNYADGTREIHLESMLAGLWFDGFMLGTLHERARAAARTSEEKLGA